MEELIKKMQETELNFEEKLIESNNTTLLEYYLAYKTNLYSIIFEFQKTLRTTNI